MFYCTLETQLTVIEINIGGKKFVVGPDLDEAASASVCSGIFKCLHNLHDLNRSCTGFQLCWHCYIV